MASPENPGSGKLLDGVYAGYGEHDYEAWIVIKNKKIVAIESFDDDGDQQDLINKYQISAPSKEWWSKEAWERKEKRELQAQKEYEEFQQSIAHVHHMNR